MKAGIAALIVAVSLAGCRPQTDAADDFPEISTPSGKPEVTIYNTDLATVKTALLNRVISHEWRISNETADALQLDKPADSRVAAMSVDSQAKTIPDERVILMIIALGYDVRVVADVMIVTNPGTGLEKRTPINGSAEARKINERLQTWLPQAVDDLRKLKPKS